MARHFALVPAAGSGSRMHASIPKQYLEIAGKPLLWHALRRLSAEPRIERVYLVLARGDVHFDTHDWSSFAGKLVTLRSGGETRAQSVLNALISIEGETSARDWILVHDAARPCLGSEELRSLIDGLRDDPDGGLLALPVADTLKRAGADGRVLATEARERMWRAQTPQMFRYELLLRALRLAVPAGITDESSAVEQLGIRPRLITGNAANLKVTYPQDFALAQIILAAMEC